MFLSVVLIIKTTLKTGVFLMVVYFLFTIIVFMYVDFGYILYGEVNSWNWC